MTELEHKAVKQSLAYNRKYSEDRDLENVLKHPEEYVDSYAYTMNIVQMLRQKAYRDGYNVGAKENGVIWHDLRTNPDDLPKERGEYIVAFKLPKGWDTTILMYNNDEYEDEYELCWFDSEYTNYNDDVIAWCEIPKFEVEE